MSFTAVRVAIGRVLLVVGVLVLLYIPYLIWGTGILAARSQATLRHQFAAEEHSVVTTPTTRPPAGTAPPPTTAPAVPDPPVGSAVGIIDIPTIGLSMTIVEGVGEAQLQEGPGHYPGTPLPGEAGNAAVAGHRTTYLRPFYDLNRLRPGDPIVITTLQGTFTYRMTTSLAVAPTDVAVVAPTTDPELTLTTCNPRYSASQRLVVHAALASSVLAHPAVAATTTPTTDPAAPSHRPRAHPAAASGLAGGAGGWGATILWGLALVGVLALGWAAVRRTRGGARVALLAAGAVGGLVVLFFFFGAVTPLLPASF